MKKNITLDELTNYIGSKYGIAVTGDTLIFDDIGLDGLDADILMTNLATDFGFSLDTFDYRKYYFSEAELPNFLELFILEYSTGKNCLPIHFLSGIC